MPLRIFLATLVLACSMPIQVAAAQAHGAAGEEPAAAHSEEEHHHGLRGVHPLAVIPFAGLLLSIAILPLAAEHFWHSNRNRAIVSIAFSIPIIAYLAYLEWVQHQPGMLHLFESLHEYLAFIILLGSLYTVSGGIVVDLQTKPHPLVNAAILAFGAVIANLIGTTGASMLLIRPFLRINANRRYKRHLPIFFIFMVSNLGGLLTPLGDPPLFLGFLRGVSFFWTMQLWREWLIANGLVLAVFLAWEITAFMREPGHDPATIRQLRLGLRGYVNLLFFGGIVGAVLLKSVWPKGTLLALFASEAIMVAMGLLALYFTPKRFREENVFGWGAIIEVAVLFIGIFITMVPALALLAEHGKEFNLTEPWQYFWLTGSLSAFLDNAPTYLTFAALAAGEHPIGWLQHHEPEILAAISCGAVFMGALTYIGNGPNFMVKAIADEAGYRTPSFFGYLLHSILILGPILLLITYIFFV